MIDWDLFNKWRSVAFKIPPFKNLNWEKRRASKVLIEWIVVALLKWDRRSVMTCLSERRRISASVCWKTSSLERERRGSFSETTSIKAIVDGRNKTMIRSNSAWQKGRENLQKMTFSMFAGNNQTIVKVTRENEKEKKKDVPVCVFDDVV